ncbi:MULTISPECIES: inovirus-type Gp2 protein [unclassified Serratia (in: enterobacteria)]|uniref:YagK/YfjJ domain-containing protein n=1 Tax=unclassified Serratia (in: enterobacteria) TaxID=2647522 RepID=UPI001CC08978|nr:inovirus-type Gp2 protein [Serratia sp. JSRIV002]UAN57643.1 inovirus-type Gp2 protein [Serratia sp. JSRIV004]
MAPRVRLIRDGNVNERASFPHSTTQLDEHGIKRTLQATIDHYPRLIALRITLRLPDPSTQPLDTLTTRFYAALLQRINVFLNSRQLAGKPTPPTQISLLWGTEGDGGIPMLLLLNQDTFYSVRHDAALQTQVCAVNALISKAWSSAIGPSNEWVQVQLSETICLRVARGEPDTYPSQYAALSNNAMQLSLPDKPAIINYLRHPAR